MIKAYLIMKGGFPSMTHARYLNKEEAQAEVDRLEKIRTEKNHKIDTNPAKGFRGAAFLNVKDNDPWTLQEREFPE